MLAHHETSELCEIGNNQSCGNTACDGKEH